MKRLLLFLTMCILSATRVVFPQTSLLAGDIAFVGVWGYNADALYDDSFAFVLLKNISAGTVIYFTDKGWTEAGAFYQAGGTGEGTYTFTAASSYSAGTVLYCYGSKSGSSPGFTYTQANPFSTIADQLIAYQGSESSPTILCAINLGNITWVSTPGTTQNTTNSWLPAGLTNGTNALSISTGADNAAYSGGANSNMTTLRNNIHNTSNWTTGTSTTRPVFPSSPLPVELTAFTAAVRNGNIHLRWETATEVNNFGFTVERSVKLYGSLQFSDWSEISFVQGKGNTNARSEYSYTDVNPSGDVIKYRLKQTDLDGSFSYVSETEVSRKPNAFTVFQNYPNPFNPDTKIRYTLPTSGNVRIEIYNSIGQRVAVPFSGHQEAGYQEFSLNSRTYSLGSGVYYYTITAQAHRVTRKMLLLQ